MPLRDLFDRKYIVSELTVLAIAGVVGAIWAWLSPGFRDFWGSAFHVTSRGVFIALGWLLDRRHEVALLLIGALGALALTARVLYRRGYRAGVLAERTVINNERAREEAFQNVMLGHDRGRAYVTVKGYIPRG